MSVTLIQERVSLRCGYNLVAFVWPLGTDEVTVRQSERPDATTVYSVQEAHDLFWSLLNAGAY
jgi:hypothetical protein